ncbi:MAG: hypothetical protein M3512_18040 [Bacteroidota bacterium]|nr:hypothetical protein [Bacteroidota bacterium]
MKILNIHPQPSRSDYLPKPSYHGFHHPSCRPHNFHDVPGELPYEQGKTSPIATGKE